MNKMFTVTTVGLAATLIAIGPAATSPAAPSAAHSPQSWVHQSVGHNTTNPNTPAGSGVTIAVIDTGVDASHPQFASKTTIGYSPLTQQEIQPGQSTDNDGHGTHVAGIIAAFAPDATIMPIDALVHTSTGDQWLVPQSIIWAVDHDADIINMSLGLTLDEENEKRTCDAVRYATARNVIVVTAAGNSGIGALPVTPASCEGAIAVGAIDETDNTPWFSSPCRNLTFAAPGLGVNSLALTQPKPFSSIQGHANQSGTSMAAPVVTGMIAALKSSGKYPTNTAIIEALKKSSTDLGKPGWDEYTGWGVPNFTAALNGLKGRRPVKTGTTPFTPVIADFVFSDRGVEMIFATLTPSIFSPTTVEILDAVTGEMIYSGPKFEFVKTPDMDERILLARVSNPEYQHWSAWEQVANNAWRQLAASQKNN
jgi:subtilisin family serine protease